jgi:membrane protease YdiL (CAAX protease family)
MLSTRSITPSSSSLRQFMQRHPLVCYFVLAYAFSWLAWLPYILSKSGLGFFPVLLSQFAILPGAYLGPCLSGFLMTAVTEGKPGIHRLLRRFVLWKVGWQWYLFTLIGVPMFLFLGYATQSGSGAAFHFPFPQFLWVYPLFLILEIFTSGLAEEPGWRGFALPRLQERYGPLLGTVMLGLLWGGWHLPLFLTAWADGSNLLGICEFFLTTISVAILITWVFNHTRGSLLMAILLHASHDTFGSVSVVTGLFQTQWMLKNATSGTLIGVGVVALLLIIVTRSRLGSQQASEDEGTSAA